MCPYSYYGKIEGYNREVILCKKNNGMCPFTRYCSKENKIIPNDRIGYTMRDCKMRYEVEIPSGSSRVRKEVSDESILYVDIEIDGELYTYKINNPYKEVPDYVYVKENIDGTYNVVEKKTRSRKQ